MIKTVLPLSFITASRFFGLFIVLPVLSLYALNLKGANEFLVGLLVGVYAITQMILQVPFGALSDKFGRKATMSFGLIVFIIGSLVCASADDIYTMLLGRLIQGSGAIGAVATAMISDFVSEEKRGHAMAIMGGMIGISFGLSMVLSPILSSKFGLSSLFYLSALLCVFCIVLLYAVVPSEIKVVHHEPKIGFLKLLKQKNLFIMNITNLMQKMLMSAAFVAIPIILVGEMGFDGKNLWIVYALASLFGFVSMGMAGFLGDAKGHSKKLLLIGVVLFIAAYLAFAFSKNSTFFIVGVVLFFIGFNLHEPIMQSCASKFALSSQKGSALGIFNAFGYCGSFLGGVLGGYFLHKFDITTLAIFYAVLSILWLALLSLLSDPKIFKNLYLESADFSKLDGILGIIERYHSKRGYVIKYNSNLINESEIRSILAG
ncbi:MFS transporter [Campylobacter hyointestinalis]|uniref:MFS transporter n=1 Tax=Campylobacter hyointestinalis TaxID=198 RepID=UPI000CE30F8F|nr:MFS transporter [Campylobacter hyointestinalis]PPB71293.1 MFS transporter [Campylobacter hyointestinalis subsp. hyointestinalis]PPB73666.1 MFS transporter [Campylobacter hyointestinalis subsp. hyointestinalis]PPB76067.1 MFS transporter [Campylobacter hyointestinalis subsp. hyointestinalis]PPB76534.1 MFS transporter [Campylobacter hyointestinalis subsp. hyointestinalis]